MSNKTFAAFIVTYNRPDILMDTIQKILDQTRPPEKLLIVDNNDNDDTKNKLAQLYPDVAHVKVGHNSGFAGGGKIGLQTLANEGYKWVLWADDNDPPYTKDTLEKLLQLGESYPGNCGQVGVVGHKINRRTGLVIRTTNDELEKGEYLEVDTIGGGMIKVIKGESVLNGVVPDPKLWFGFEDLDHDLSQQRAGYKILVHSGLFLDLRKKWNRLNIKKTTTVRKKDESVLWRDYYSIRNSLRVMVKNGYYLAFVSILFVSIAKTLVSYKYGFRYGRLVTKTTFKAVRDYGLSRWYKR
ncbi:MULTISPECIES: glycosyltransferase [Niastella]|uniref:Glycosyltransferase n=1 Tax=Niastella soli TaxID=2821487 RepID=A0ABS3YLW3_9BACT|nr:glycosyltransferase [Niastella soli]MBO9198834.1 glycosyltransferase [Niastella soli]